MNEASFTFEKYYLRRQAGGGFKLFKNERLIIFSKIISIRHGHAICNVFNKQIKCLGVKVDCEKGREYEFYDIRLKDFEENLSITIDEIDKVEWETFDQLYRFTISLNKYLENNP